MRIQVALLPQAGITESTALDLRGRSRDGARDRKIVEAHLAPAPQEDRFAHLKRILNAMGHCARRETPTVWVQLHLGGSGAEPVSMQETLN